MTASQFHCATVPDGPDCQWKGGEYQRIEARPVAIAAPAARSVLRPDAVFLRWEPCAPSNPITDDLSIPALRAREARVTQNRKMSVSIIAAITKDAQPRAATVALKVRSIGEEARNRSAPLRLARKVRSIGGGGACHWRPSRACARG
jgi:hypothetical protein